MSMDRSRVDIDKDRAGSDTDILLSVCLRHREANFADPFHEEWWLDAATNGQFDIIEIRHGGILRLRMPIHISKRLCFNCIDMPVYTRTLHPILYLPPSKPFKHAQNIRHLIEELVQKLPKHDSIRVRLGPDDETAFGFSLVDFTCEEQFTFRVPYPSDLGAIWKNCDQKTRNVIRSAQHGVSIEYGYDFAEFMRLSLLNRPEKENIHNFKTMERIFDAARIRNQALIVSARNDADQTVGAVILVWGSSNAYFWQSARDPACGIGGVNALLLWKSIEFADRMGLTFDFDGYGSVKSAKFLAGFGLPPVARVEVSRKTIPYKCFDVFQQTAPYILLKSAKDQRTKERMLKRVTSTPAL